MPLVVHGKGIGKMVVCHAFCSSDSSDDEAEPILPLVSSPHGPGQGKIVGDTEFTPHILSFATIQI